LIEQLEVSLAKAIAKWCTDSSNYVRSVAIGENKLGVNHPSTKTIRENLQILRQQLDRPQMNWWQRLWRKFL
jgi:hypothetical protein